MPEVECEPAYGYYIATPFTFRAFGCAGQLPFVRFLSLETPVHHVLSLFGVAILQALGLRIFLS